MGGLTLSMDDIRDELQIAGVITKINVTLDNTLIASTTEIGSLAFIDKKDFDITVETGIPEPSTFLLGVLGLALGSCLVRRRHAA